MKSNWASLTKLIQLNGNLERNSPLDKFNSSSSTSWIFLVYFVLLFSYPTDEEEEENREKEKELEEMEEVEEKEMEEVEEKDKEEEKKTGWLNTSKTPDFLFSKFT